MFFPLCICLCACGTSFRAALTCCRSYCASIQTRGSLPRRRYSTTSLMTSPTNHSSCPLPFFPQQATIECENTNPSNAIKYDGLGMYTTRTL
jgi:hypothetical protein